MKNNLTIAILERYLKGECSAEERAVVNGWYNSLEKENDLVSALDLDDESALREKIYDSILSRIQSENDLPQTNERYFTRFRLAGYAAMATAAMLLIYIGFFRSSTVVP